MIRDYPELIDEDETSKFDIFVYLQNLFFKNAPSSDIVKTN